MMKAVYKTDGAELAIDILSTPQVREFMDAHAVALDSSFEKVDMSDAMRRRLQRSNFVFSGMKSYHEVNEALSLLYDDNGVIKPFEQFLNDARNIDEIYNRNWLRSEYNFVASSAQMASKWERFMADGDRYNLQYRTQKDDKVRPEHAALDGVTLPPSDSFWEEFYPPNGWNCRCTVVQVRKSKYTETPHDEAMRLGDDALQRDTKGIFRFNPGLEQKSEPKGSSSSPGHSCRTMRSARLASTYAPVWNSAEIPDSWIIVKVSLKMRPDLKPGIRIWRQGIFTRLKNHSNVESPMP